MHTRARRGFHAGAGEQSAPVTGNVPTAGADGSEAPATRPDRSVPQDGRRARRSTVGSPTSNPMFDAAPNRAFDAAPNAAVERTVRNAPRHGAHPGTTMSGTLDPVRDVLPTIEDQRTQVIPALDEQGWVRSDRTSQHSQNSQHSRTSQHPRTSQYPRTSRDLRHDEPTHRFRRPDHDRSSELTHPQLNVRAARAYGRHAAAGTPAEGFPRSLSWNGRIGTVRKEVPPDQTFGGIVDPGAGLVQPSEDPAVAPAFEPADGIVALWQGALGRTPAATPAGGPAPAPTIAEGGLLSPESVDLASGELPKTNSRRHLVPGGLLSAALSPIARPPHPKADVLPVQLPGDHQEQVDELPDVSRGIALTADPGSEIPGIYAPLPGLEDLAALGRQVSAPLSRITEALDGQDSAVRDPLPSRLPGFTDAPLRSSVVLREVDDLLAAVPERERVIENPFRLDDAKAVGGMSLPLLDGGWSRFRNDGGSVPSRSGASEREAPTDTLPVVSAV